MEAHFSLFGYSVILDARQVHGLRQMHLRFRNHFGCTRWYSDVMWVKWSIVSVHLVIVLTSTQDWCMVCPKCTIGPEISLNALDVTLR